MTSTHLPTCGYSTQAEAIITLHLSGFTNAKEIGSMVDCSVNSVYRAILIWRRRTGTPKPGKVHAPAPPRTYVTAHMWEATENKRRAMFHARAVKAAAALRKAAAKQDSHA